METSDSGQWREVAQVGDIEESDVKGCLIGALCLAIFNVKGAFYATSDICTHAHAHLSDGYVDDDTVECPLHQGRFHIPTGKAISAPPTEDLRTFPIRVEGGKIFVKVD